MDVSATEENIVLKWAECMERVPGKEIAKVFRRNEPKDM
jgi:hypothetical protein